MPRQQDRVSPLGLLVKRITLVVVSVMLFTTTAANATRFLSAEVAAQSPTGYTLAEEFAAFYNRAGGLALLGYPVSQARVEGGYLVQWTERQRLEWHPENAGTDYEVLLGLLGRELTRGLGGPDFTPQAGTGDLQGSFFFKETRQAVTEPFESYWRQRGGLRVFGFPISRRYKNENGLEIQWFERARFEYHPDLPAGDNVLLGHLGIEAQKQSGVPLYELEVSGSVAPDTGLKLDIAQGGESEDPGFLDNARQAGSDLGPGLVRLDNIFNFYNIVQRDTTGAIRYDWRELDRVLDTLTAMGKKPLICLSYMPETISATGNSRIHPPLDYLEWADLVTATVTHINVERKLGVRYWEVWNEPNEWSFWRGSFPEYLRLYDVTVEAATKADHSIAIGGPALSRFSEDHLREFFSHEASLGAKGRADFVSWHSYGQSPAQIAGDIRKAREVASAYPQFNPELFITEFNVLQGAGDTSANANTDKVEGAIALLQAVESMQRERLDRAFLFELKDGLGLSRFWGRWGILANDGTPKPIYHALKAYLRRPTGSLPVLMKNPMPGDSLGLMAYGSPKNSTLLLWYTGSGPARVKIALPGGFAQLQFDQVIFDALSNNPARSGDSTLRMSSPRYAGDLLFELKRNTLIVLTSR